MNLLWLTSCTAACSALRFALSSLIESFFGMTGTFLLALILFLSSSFSVSSLPFSL